MKKVVLIDGGIGRVITSIPAVEELAKKEEVVVITSWIEPYMNNENIYRVYRIDHPYLFEDVIYENELIHPEPYTYHRYYRDKIHLIQAFWELILHQPAPKLEEVRPNIYLTPEEERIGKEIIKGVKQQFGRKKKVIVFQPFGATAMVDNDVDMTSIKLNDVDIKDPSNRSLPVRVVKEIVKRLKDKYILLYFGNLPLPDKSLVVPMLGQGQPLNLRLWFSVIKHADYFLGVDSVGQHVAYSFNKPGTVLMGATYESNVSYPHHFRIFKREGYPKAYDPIRLPVINPTSSASKKNQGALEFTEKEIEKLINYINKDLE